MKFLPQLAKPTIQASLALIMVFLIDIYTPLGIAIGVLYLLCFYLVSTENKKTIILFAVTTCLLTFLKLILFATPDTSFMVYLNRAVSVLVIIIVALLSLRHRILLDKYHAERDDYTKELEQIIFLTSHRVRKPITNCMGIVELLTTENNLTNEEIRQLAHYLKPSILELDGHTKELAKFINEINTKKRQQSPTSSSS